MAKPTIRFKGYTDDWEQRKLGELYQRNTERNENLIGYDKTISVATMSYKDDGNGASESSLSTYKVLRVGDIAFEGHTNKQFRFGRFVVNDIGTGIMSPRFSTLRPLNEMPVNFWKQYIHSESVMRRILVNSTKAGTMMNELVIPEFLNQTIMVPSENEQAVIGQYFTNIDHLITLHQRKCEETKKLKKYMLQKMFPQNGKRVPEIRFAGFTDDWEQRKLSEIATMHARIGWQNLRTSEFLDSGDYMLITGTDFEDGTINYSTCHYVEKERYEQDKNIQIRNGSILITKDGTLGKVAYVQGLTMPATLNAGVFNVEIKDKKETDEKYLFQYLKAPFLMDYVTRHATGGTIKHLNQSILINFPVYMPKKSEQEKIGLYLMQLDSLITLHQRKYEELQKIKKFMLQNMFI